MTAVRHKIIRTKPIGATDCFESHGTAEGRSPFERLEKRLESLLQPSRVFPSECG